MLVMGSSQSSGFPSVCDIHYPPYGSSLLLSLLIIHRVVQYREMLATGFSILRCLMSNRWPIRRTRSAFSVSPDILNSTSSALDQVYRVTSTTVRGGFHVKSRASCCTAKHSARFYMDTCLQRECLHGLFPL